MKIFITGSGGFIGNNLKKHLEHQHFLVTPRSFELDLTCEDAVKNFFKLNDIDFIIHCASVGGIRGVEDKPLTIVNNIAMVNNLIKFKKQDTKIILFGSGAMYDKSRRLHKVKEDDIGKSIPKDLYGLSKLEIYNIIKDRKDALMLNIFGCYGYGEKESRFPSYAIIQNLKKEPIVINNNTIFDYLFVEDMVKIVEYFINSPTCYNLINITPNKSVSMLDIANEVNKISAYKSEIVTDKINFESEYTGDNSRLNMQIPNIKYTPLYTGIKKLFDYIKQNQT